MVDVSRFSAYPYPPPSGLAGGDDPPPSTTAITITLDDFAAVIGFDDLTADRARYQRLYEMAQERINNYAPLAPTAVKNEAMVRFGGYFAQSDFGGVQSEAIGPRSVTYTPPSTNAAAFRHSGAAALLSPYRRRRAGAV